MKILSTYGDVDQGEDLYIKTVKCILPTKPDSAIQATDTQGGFYFKDIPPGESFNLELDLNLNDLDPHYIIINWFCNATKTRGALFYDSDDNLFKGDINGTRIRESLSLSPQFVDEQGRILSSGSRCTLWLEGRQSYFPTHSAATKAPFSHSFVHLEIDITSGRDSLFSKETVQAVYNINSRFCDPETGSPYEGTPKFFSLYEVWRQLIEVVLNNDDITNFQFDEVSDERTVVSIVCSVLQEIFPNSSYIGIKQLRSREYPRFCSQIQSYFFERCK
jgi:hypothetical protein